MGLEFRDPMKKEHQKLLEEFLGRPISQDEAEAADARMIARWFDSGETDLAIYGSEDYVLHFILTQGYSTNLLGSAIRFLKKHSILPRTVLDYSCGLGFTTRQLAQAFPDAHVVGSEWAESQLEICKFVTKDLPNVEFVTDEQLRKTQPHFDCVTVIEVFEHLKDPLRDLEDLVNLTSSNVLIDSCSFGIPAPGHYSFFTSPYGQVNGNKMKRLFSTKLRELGYLSRGKLWNNKPRVMFKE